MEIDFCKLPVEQLLQEDSEWRKRSGRKEERVQTVELQWGREYL